MWGMRHSPAMARKLRLQYPGAIYHLMSRGDRREPVFLDDADRPLFLCTLAEACAKTDWQVHAYCLMNNHFHLVVETPKANLVAGMKWLLGTYTARFNRKHKLFGHLFSGRYKSLLVDNSGNGYLKTVCDYVHLNPVRAGLLRPGQALAAFSWSSYGQYLRPPGRRAPWLRVDRLLGEMAIAADSAAGRREFGRRMEASRRAEVLGEYRKIRRGWCYGEEAFRRELLLQASRQLGEHHYGRERRESEEDKAERMVAAGLKEAGWRESDLACRRKGDPVKIGLAGRLRRETTLPLKWICGRLEMGSWKSVNRRLYESRHAKC
jgi:REP element-mobilizing transposase RayT